MFLATHGVIRNNTISTSYLLDTYGGASAAYSLRKLSTAYIGSAIRVRRSSDNAEQNIGFSGDDLDTASLLTFVGAGNGFVTTWYDQSGNINNATQPTALYQPNIVTSGTLITIGGQVSIDCYNKDLRANSIDNTSQSTFIAYQNETTLNYSSFNLPFTTINVSSFIGAVSSGNGSDPYYGITPPIIYYRNNTLISSPTRGILYSNFVDGTKKLASIVGGGTTYTSRSLQYPNPYTGNYKVFEVIIYPSDKSTDRSNINTNINTYYAIY
jgi:hypothetical protein